MHFLMYYKKEICDEDLIKTFLNQDNSNFIDSKGCNILHFACLTHDLNIVKHSIKIGGPIKQIKVNLSEYPSDKTENKEIKEYFKQIP